MTHDDDTQLLHRYVDGDLSDAERTALLARAASDPTVRARIEGLLEVRRLVEEVSEDACRDLDSGALFAGIEAKLAAEPAGADQSVDELTGPRRPALRVLPGGRDEGAKAPAEVPAEVRRRRVIGVVIAGLAVAAAAVIALTQYGEPPEVARVEAPEAPEAPAPPEATVADAEPARTEVLEVDFGTNAGTIFAVEGDEGDRYVVVWLEEDAPSTN
jgi:anti-sigma factor RsiW